MKRPPRILVLRGGGDTDGGRLLREIERAGYEPVCERVDTPQALREALARGPWDAVVTDGAEEEGEGERDRIVDELKRAVEVRDSFLAIASHELRTPLTSLKLTVQGLKRAHTRGTLANLPPERLSNDIDVIDRQIVRIGVLVQNLLDVATVTSDGMRLSRETVDLAELVRSVIFRTTESTRPPPPIQLVVSDSVVGAWDRLRVETIASNLVANAVKFGEGKPIEVSVAREDGSARLTVTDHGIGISAEEQARIFEKFERAVPVEHYGGFGLGLWIVRQIVDAHGGTIEVTSAPGLGSTFVVRLPLAPLVRTPGEPTARA